VLSKVRSGLFVLKGRAPVQLRLSTRTIDGILIADCAGRIVFGEESAYLRDTVKKFIAEKNNLVLNLSGVTYIDSGGLGTLVALYTTARNSGSSIKLANLTRHVGDLLQVTKLVTIFDVYDSEQQAVDSFRKGAAA
jgi:anti-sigma B factor antagonist